MGTRRRSRRPEYGLTSIVASPGVQAAGPNSAKTKFIFSWPTGSNWCLLVVAVTLLVFAPTLGGQFVAIDDNIHVFANPHLRPLSWDGLLAVWCEPYEGHYVPLSYTWFALETWFAERWSSEYATAGVAPEIYHAGCWLLHAANACLAWWLLFRLTGHPTASAVGALVFAIHPLQVESVAWISETRGLLSSFFSMVSLALYIKAVERATHSASDNVQSRWHFWLWYGLASLAFLAALLAKPSAINWPLVTFVVDVGLLSNTTVDRCRAIVRMIPWVALAGFFALLTKQEQPDTLLTWVTPLMSRPLIALDAVTFYLAKLVWPFHLSVHQDFAPQDRLQSTAIYGTSLIPILLAAALLWRPLRRYIPAALISVMVLSPVLGLVPFAFQRWTTVADRYAYLALLGPALAVAMWLSDRSTPRTWWMSCGVLALWGVISWWQCFVWHDDQTLFTHALSVYPASDMAHHNLGHYYLEHDQNDAAEQHFRQALQRTDSDKFHASLGVALVKLGRTDEAAAELHRAIEMNPNDEQSYTNLGVIAKLQDRLDEAIQWHRKAIDVNPRYAIAWLNLGNTFYAQNKLSEALAAFDQAARLDPYFEAPRQHRQIVEEALRK